MDWTDGRAQLLAIAVLVTVLIAAIVGATGSLPASIPGVEGGEPTPERPAAVADQLQNLHGEGVTGENVTVAVLDPTGFDTDHPTLVGRVAATRAFAPAEGIGNGGQTEHGTAAAVVVARTAPAAQLYLASFNGADEFVEAVDWAIHHDVDVIVAPVGFYGKRGDGSSQVARAAAAAVDQGIVFVAPSGNIGQNHWRGTFTPDDDGRHQFQGGVRNYLLGERRQVSLWVSWPAEPPNGSYALELYQTNGSDSRLVARSQPFPGDELANERIVADVDPDGTYYVVLRGSANADGTVVELASPTHSFQYQRRARSVVAPATAESVISVGAADATGERVAPFSSAGPVGAGRPGVDVVAPGVQNVTGRPTPFEGSSAAAAYVAGVAALLFQAAPSLSPAAVEGLLETTARDLGRPGVDAVSGAGLVHPVEAVARGRNTTQSQL